MIMSQHPHHHLFSYGHFSPVANRFANPPMAMITSTPVSGTPTMPGSSSSSSGMENSSYSSDSGRDGSIFGSPPHLNVSGGAKGAEVKEPQTPSRTSQYKKIMKPLLERKRRARINKCLDELKDLMTTALQEQGENVSKLEKADILELTVRHLHKMKQAKCLTSRNPVEEFRRFQTGYTSCAHEAASFLLNTPGVDLTVGQGLLSYLSTQVNNPLPAATAVQSRMATPPEGSFPSGHLGSLLKMDLLQQASVASPFNSQILPNPGLMNSLPSPQLSHLKFPKSSQHASEMNLVRGSGLTSTSSLTPPPLQRQLKPQELPPRPSSTPETTGEIRVSIMALNSKTSRFNDLDSNGAAQVQPRASTPKMHLVPSSSVIKPEPVKLCQTVPVWRPF